MRTCTPLLQYVRCGVLGMCDLAKYLRSMGVPFGTQGQENNSDIEEGGSDEDGEFHAKVLRDIQPPFWTLLQWLAEDQMGIHTKQIKLHINLQDRCLFLEFWQSICAKLM